VNETSRQVAIIREELKRRGITQRQFATMCRVPQPRISDILRGKKDTTTKWAEIMLAALGLGVSDLIRSRQ